jgi:hypothetical protein
MLPKKAGRLIRVKNFSLFEGGSPSLRNSADQPARPATRALSEQMDGLHAFPRRPMA